MKTVKKFIVFLACVCILAIFIEFTPVYAETTTLDANVWYDFTLQGGLADEYIFEMPSSGYFYYEVVPDYYIVDGEISSSTSWWIPVKMIVNYKNYEDSSCHCSDGIWTSHNYSFKEGTKIQLDFISTSSSNYTWHYKVRIVTVETKNFETESNNSKSKADKIKVGKTYTGLVMQDDEDWFVFTAPKTGKYKIYGVNTDTTINSSTIPYVYNSGYKLLQSTSLVGGDGWKTIYSGTLKKGSKIYVKVPYSNWYNLFYKLKIKSVS